LGAQLSSALSSELRQPSALNTAHVNGVRAPTTLNNLQSGMGAPAILAANKAPSEGSAVVIRANSP
jgi:hypothetical protein